jgi:hypothetical protein
MIVHGNSIIVLARWVVIVKCRNRVRDGTKRPRGDPTHVHIVVVVVAQVQGRRKRLDRQAIVKRTP